MLSSASNIWIKTSPRIPPPSIHKMRPPMVDFLKKKSIHQNLSNGKIVHHCQKKTYNLLLAAGGSWQTWSRMSSKRWRVRGILFAGDGACPSTYPLGLHPSPHADMFWEQRFASTARTQYNSWRSVLELLLATEEEMKEEHRPVIKMTPPVSLCK